MLGIDSRERMVLRVIGAAITVAALVWFGSENAGAQEVVVRASSIALIILLFPAIYAGKLVSIPPKINGEQITKIIGLEEAAKPKLLIEEPGDGYNQPIIENFENAATATPIRKERNRCRIQIKNIGGENLGSVKVKLEKIISLHDGNEIHHAGFGLPLKLATQQGLDELNEPYRQSFVLSPGEATLIDVFSHHRPIDGRPNADFLIGWALQAHETRTITRKLQAGNYEFVIRVYADKGGPTEKRFIVELKDGLAEMEPKDD